MCAGAHGSQKRTSDSLEQAVKTDRYQYGSVLAESRPLDVQEVSAKRHVYIPSFFSAFLHLSKSHSLSDQKSLSFQSTKKKKTSTVSNYDPTERMLKHNKDA